MLLKDADLNAITIKRTITISPNASILDARQVLLRHNLKRLVVIDSKKRPVGIITEKDIAKTIYALGDKPIGSVKISGFMSKKLITIRKTDSIYNCAKLMKKNHISSIVVLDNNGRAHCFGGAMIVMQDTGDASISLSLETNGHF